MRHHVYVNFKGQFPSQTLEFMRIVPLLVHSCDMSCQVALSYITASAEWALLRLDALVDAQNVVFQALPPIKCFTTG